MKQAGTARNQAGRRHGGTAAHGVRAAAARQDRGGLVLSHQAAAAYSGLPPSTLRDSGLRGEIPIVRFGTRWFFRRADLDALIEQHTERSEGAGR